MMQPFIHDDDQAGMVMPDNRRGKEILPRSVPRRFIPV
jgi:hypothetical protein